MTISARKAISRSSAFRTLARARQHPRDSALAAALAFRKAKFRLLSTHQALFSEAHIVGPVLAIGHGTISARGSRLGYWPSPAAFDGYIHLEARHPGSRIEIGTDTRVNNGCVFISEGPGIFVGRSALIGPGVTVFDSDFHVVDARRRGTAPVPTGAVHIGDHVFIGAGAIVTKGVTIGDNAVVGAGAVVTADVAPDTIVAGNPARVVSRTVAESGP